MSKVYRFLQYFLLLIFLSLLLLSIKPNSVFADQTDWTNWKIKMTPDPATSDTKQITFTVSRTDDNKFFTTNTPYTAIVWTDLDHSCRMITRRSNVINPNFHGKYNLGELTTEESRAIVTWNTDTKLWENSADPGCTKEGVKWHFRLFVGDNDEALNNRGNYIIDDWLFTFTQPGGNLVTIVAKNDGNVFAGEKPVVIITNADPKEDYTFWWKDAQFEVAAYYSRDKDKSLDALQEVIIPTFSTGSPSRTLCMEYGNFLVPPGGNDCNPSVKFYFKTGQPAPPAPPPTTQGKCDLYAAHLPELAHSDGLIVGYKKALPNEEYTLIADPDKDPKERKAKSDSEGRVLIKVTDNAKKWDLGPYTVKIVDSKKELLCDGSFSISENGSSLAESQPCITSDSKSCTFAGTDSICDSDNPRGPGIRTAIGCIHTSPPELVKDLMAFIIGISGGLAFLMMLLGSFQMLTSAGNPETLHAGRERLTSAIIGLLLVIFAVLLLQIIGIGILNIPGFK